MFLHAVRWPATLDKLIYPVDQSIQEDWDAIGTVYTLLIGIFSQSLICTPCIQNTHEQIYTVYHFISKHTFSFRLQM